jgi:hypothetical protein
VDAGAFGVDLIGLAPGVPPACGGIYRTAHAGVIALDALKAARAAASTRRLLAAAQVGSAAVSLAVGAEGEAGDGARRHAKISDYIPDELKRRCSAAFQDNSLLSKMSAEDREQGAVAYENMADDMQNREAGLARLYNLERAKFLRGTVESIPGTAREFGEQIGFGK